MYPHKGRLHTDTTKCVFMLLIQMLPYPCHRETAAYKINIITVMSCLSIHFGTHGLWSGKHLIIYGVNTAPTQNMWIAKLLDYSRHDMSVYHYCYSEWKHHSPVCCVCARPWPERGRSTRLCVTRMMRLSGSRRRNC